MMKIINGEFHSPLNIALSFNVRCKHGVIDGDKPITVNGPRCLACRKQWVPLQETKTIEDWKGDKTVQQVFKCPECYENLHLVYSPELDEDKYVAYCLAHTAPRPCWLNAYPIPGRENLYSGFGWGSKDNWEKYSDSLITIYANNLEAKHRGR